MDQVCSDLVPIPASTPEEGSFNLHCVQGAKSEGMATGDERLRVGTEVDPEQGHYLEFGPASWNEDEVSVRDCYPTASGGFSLRCSSEVPVDDVALIAVETLKRDLMTRRAAEMLVKAANDFLLRAG